MGRPTLHSLASKVKSCSDGPCHDSLHTNIRYLSSPEKRQRIATYRDKKKALTAKVVELKRKFVISVLLNFIFDFV